MKLWISFSFLIHLRNYGCSKIQKFVIQASLDFMLSKIKFRVVNLGAFDFFSKEITSNLEKAHGRSLRFVAFIQRGIRSVIQFNYLTPPPPPPFQSIFTLLLKQARWLNQFVNYRGSSGMSKLCMKNHEKDVTKWTAPALDADWTWICCIATKCAKHKSTSTFLSQCHNSI